MDNVIGIMLLNHAFFRNRLRIFSIIFLINLVDPTNMKEIRHNCFETEIPIKLN